MTKATDLTAAEKRTRFWWGTAHPTAKHKKLMYAFLAIEAVSLALFALNRIVG